MKRTSQEKVLGEAESRGPQYSQTACGRLKGIYREYVHGIGWFAVCVCHVLTSLVEESAGIRVRFHFMNLAFGRPHLPALSPSLRIRVIIIYWINGCIVFKLPFESLLSILLACLLEDRGGHPLLWELGKERNEYYRCIMAPPSSTLQRCTAP